MHGIGLRSTVAPGIHSPGTTRLEAGRRRRPVMIRLPCLPGPRCRSPLIAGHRTMEGAYEPEARSETARIGSEPPIARARERRKSSPPLPQESRLSRSVPRSACHLTHLRARTVPGLPQQRLPRVACRKNRSARILKRRPRCILHGSPHRLQSRTSGEACGQILRVGVQLALACISTHTLVVSGRVCDGATGPWVQRAA